MDMQMFGYPSSGSTAKIEADVDPVRMIGTVIRAFAEANKFTGFLPCFRLQIRYLALMRIRYNHQMSVIVRITV